MDAIAESYEIIGIAFATTVLLFVFSGIGSLLLGSLLVTLRVGPIGVMRRTAATYVTLVRNTPLLLILLFFSSPHPRSASTSSSSRSSSPPVGATCG